MPHVHFWGKRGRGMGDTDCFRRSQLVKQRQRFSCVINAAHENWCALWNPVSRGLKEEEVLFWNSIYVMTMNEISILDNSSITSGFPLSLVNGLQVVSFSFFFLFFSFGGFAIVGKKNNTLLFNLIYQVDLWPNDSLLLELLSAILFWFSSCVTPRSLPVFLASSFYFWPLNTEVPVFVCVHVSDLLHELHGRGFKHHFYVRKLPTCKQSIFFKFLI